MASKNVSTSGRNNKEKTCVRNLFSSQEAVCGYNNNYGINERRVQEEQYFDGNEQFNIEKLCKTQPLVADKEDSECSVNSIYSDNLKCVSVSKNKTSFVMKKSENKVKRGRVHTAEKQTSQSIIKTVKVSPKIKKRPNKYFGSECLHVFSNQTTCKNYFKCTKYKTLNEQEVRNHIDSNEKNKSVFQLEHCDSSSVSTINSQSFLELCSSDVYRCENNEKKMFDEGCSRIDRAEECSDEEISLAQEIKSERNCPSNIGDSYNMFLKEVLFDYFYTINFCDVENFLTYEDQNYVNALIRIQLPAQRLYGRLLARQHKWIRMSSMKYDKVSKNLSDDLMTLEECGLITSDYTSESLKTLLNLLRVPEIKSLCKNLNLKVSGNKEKLVSDVLSVGNQPSVDQYFSSQKCANKNHILSKLSELLGTCIKVTDSSRQIFLHCLIFFSYPHYRGLERDRFNEQLRLLSDRRWGLKVFPDYTVCRNTIFQKKDYFLLYAAALTDRSSVLEAIERKKWNDVVKLAKEIVEKYTHLDEEEKQYAESLPDYLRYFTAGSCYVSAISKSIQVLRSKASVDDAKNYLRLLLNQKVFFVHHRSSWYEKLALLYQENLKDNMQAAEVILEGLQDKTVGTVARHILSARGELLIKRKKNCLSNSMKEALQCASESSLTEPPSLTISGFSLPNTQQGYKQIYLQNSDEGQELSSVEEVAKNYFLSKGYKYGRCDEGQTIKSLILVCFWDIMYDHTFDSEGSIFHSQCQKAPLDWNTNGFYKRRKVKLENRLKDIAEGGVEKIISLVTLYVENNMNTQSVVNWSCLDNLILIKGLIESVGTTVLSAIARLLLTDHASYSAGFPDLTLWDPDNKKCLFVEVKGRNDQLSVKQKLWLHNLMRFSAQTRVCHVTSIGCKSMKRKASSSESSEDE